MQSAEMGAVTEPEDRAALGDPSLVSWLHSFRAGDPDWEDAVQTALVELLDRPGPERLTRGLVLRRCNSRYVDLCRRSWRRGEISITSEPTAPVLQKSLLPPLRVLRKLINSIISTPGNWGLRSLAAQTARVVLSTKCRDMRELAPHLGVSKWTAKRRLELAVCAIRTCGQGK